MSILSPPEPAQPAANSTVAPLRRRAIVRAVWWILATFVLVAAFRFGARVRTLMALRNDTAYPTIDGFYYLDVPEMADAAVRNASLNERGIHFTNELDGAGQQSPPVLITGYVLGLIPWRDDPVVRRTIVQNLDFLIEDALPTPRGNLVFPYRFDWPMAEQKQIWFSGMAQGQVASAMLWGHRITGDRKYHEAARKAILAIGEEQYRMTKPLEKGLWLEEFPGYSAAVLDGTLAGIAGIYDLRRSLPDDDPDRPEVDRLLAECLKGFQSNWRVFDSDAGHWFDDQHTLNSDCYHKANLSWLTYLSPLDPEFLEIRKRYEASDEFMPCVLDTAQYGVLRILKVSGLYRWRPRIK